MSPLDGPKPRDFLQAFQDDPDLLAYARAEIARLREPGQRTLAEHDHESKIRCQTLERMVRQYEDTQ